MKPRYMAARRVKMKKPLNAAAEERFRAGSPPPLEPGKKKGVLVSRGSAGRVVSKAYRHRIRGLGQGILILVYDWLAVAKEIRRCV